MLATRSRRVGSSLSQARVPTETGTGEFAKDAGEDSLLSGNSVTAHALARLGNLSQDILAGQVAGSQHAGPDRKTSAIALEPAPSGTDHDMRLR